MHKKTAEAIRMYTTKDNCDMICKPIMKLLDADYEFIDLEKDFIL